MVLTQVIKGWGSNSLPKPAGLNLTGICLHASKPQVAMQTLPLTSSGRWAQRKASTMAQVLLGGISPLLPPHLSGQHLGAGEAANCFPPSPAAAVSLPPQHPAGVVSYISRKADGIHWCTARSKIGHHATSANRLPPMPQGACVGEAPQGGGDYLPHTPSLAGGEWQEPCTPILPISDVSEQKALKTAEGPGKKGFRESAHIHGLKCSASENHQLTPGSCCCES